MYLPPLLDLYNDLMDIDPGQTKESMDLQSAQQTTNFFRDMLMLMQETYHQIEVIEQWGIY